MEIDDELKQLEKDNKKTSITPSLKGELEKRLNIIKAEEDEQSDFDSEDNKYMLNHLNIDVIRGLANYILSSPNVLAETKRHFNCPTATGM